MSRISSNTQNKDILRGHFLLTITKTKLGMIFNKCVRKILLSSSTEHQCTRSKISQSLLKEWIECPARKPKSWHSSLTTTDSFPMKTNTTTIIESTRRTFTISSSIKITKAKAWQAGAQLIPYPRWRTRSVQRTTAILVWLFFPSLMRVIQGSIMEFLSRTVIATSLHLKKTKLCSLAWCWDKTLRLKTILHLALWADMTSKGCSAV